VVALARRIWWTWRRHRPPRYEPDVCRVIRRIVQPGWVCADVGAYAGWITRELARSCATSGRVVAFEPNPTTFDQLHTALARGGYLDLVTIENVAVGDIDSGSDTVPLYAGRTGNEAEWNLRGRDITGAATQAVAEVRVVTLDRYFQPGSPLDFVKIDVEGAEGAVLRGMRRLLREQRPALVIEFHDEQSWADRAELLDAHYTLYDLGGRPLRADAERAYHCLALPNQAPWSARHLG
jgi:FkbM family methyltransferase